MSGGPKGAKRPSGRPHDEGPGHMVFDGTFGCFTYAAGNDQVH